MYVNYFISFGNFTRLAVSPWTYVGNSNRPNKRGTNQQYQASYYITYTYSVRYALYLDKLTKIGFHVCIIEGTARFFAQNYNMAQKLTRKVLLEEPG